MNVTQKDTNPKDAAAQGRVPLYLLSPIAKAIWALAQFAGMTKYGAWNWRITGVRASVYLSAMGRHLDAYLSGEELDPVDQTHHLGNIMACAAILLDARAAGKLVDDRPPVVGIRDTYQAMEALTGFLAEKYKDAKPRHCTIADPVIPPSAPVPAEVADTIPSGPLVSVSLSSTDPDADPPSSLPSVEVPVDVFTDAAPDTLKSSQEARVDEYIRPEHVRDVVLAYRVIHLRGDKAHEHTSVEDAVEAWKAVQAYSLFAKPGDRIGVFKDGELIHSQEV